MLTDTKMKNGPIYKTGGGDGGGGRMSKMKLIETDFFTERFEP